MLKHCEVKRGIHGGDFEVSCSFMLHMYVAIVATHSNTRYLFQVLISRLKKSDKDFNVKASPGGKIIQLREINNLANFQSITCQVKVLSIENPVEVPRGKNKTL